MEFTDADASDVIPSVSTVVVVYGEEPWLAQCVISILRSEGVAVEVVLVENGGSEATIAELELLDGVRVIRPGRNTGFAGGCNLGVAGGASAFLALINPDATVDPDALRTLVAAAARPEIGVATASVRLADDPSLLNSAGNDINCLGLSWAGHFGEPALSFDAECDVASASGTGLVCRREHWEQLGGLSERFFAYYEDAEFSIRTWQRGLRVVFIPEAIVVHRYEFSRNPTKFLLLERNRLFMMLTCFDLRHLMAIAPLAAAMELGILLIAARDGWLRQKVRSYVEVAASLTWIRSRRSQVMADRLVTPHRFDDLLTTSLRPGNMPGAHPPRLIEQLVALYWHLARAVVRL